MGKDHERGAKNKVLKLYVGENRDRVAETAGMADHRVISDVHVLPEVAVLANAPPLLDMAEMPDGRKVTHPRPRIHDGTLMFKDHIP